MLLTQVSEATGVRSHVDRVRQKTGDQVVSSLIASNEFMGKPKFSECLPKQKVQELLGERPLNPEDVRTTLGRDVAVV
jgi:hypothetical protein